MVGLIRTLTPSNGMQFEEILSFETKNYYGIYNGAGNEFMVIGKEDTDLNIYFIDFSYCHSLDDLDRETFELCEEHIIGVSTSNKYKLQIIED